MLDTLIEVIFGMDSGEFYTLVFIGIVTYFGVRKIKRVMKRRRDEKQLRKEISLEQWRRYEEHQRHLREQERIDQNALAQEMEEKFWEEIRNEDRKNRKQ